MEFDGEAAVGAGLIGGAVLATLLYMGIGILVGALYTAFA